MSAVTGRICIGLWMGALGQVLATGLRPGHGVTRRSIVCRGRGTGLDVWVAAIGYGFQLFFNFAGYFAHGDRRGSPVWHPLEENFGPSVPRDHASEFWTRWHMSLSSWIRDYVFLPSPCSPRNVVAQLSRSWCQ